ncbi:hypothetical protein Q4566_05895 [Tamlana sp. 2_MG-2023]|uniref:hypothetical protein n=1 Tax=unclassified Tamlana TaxID=2614803 RepID=UPI0026E14E03|nr:MULTISPECIES: hypothetical protein [unclassified Tamlana]MDO6759726.1 hypothetical protein [Tamlana sp. 2_MG-2023]MDO6791349.1 hypothetical protein [Tamlana sp. 1_MG-2023]
MKSIKILSTLLFGLAITFTSCKEETKAPKQNTVKPVTTTRTATAEPAQNTSGTWHYICMKGCPGGSGTAENCKTCGMTLIHNQAYHANANNVQSSSPFAAPPTAEPSQNAAGVWHYTCTKGCMGGSGTAGTCKSCGNALAHNAAYHG